MILPVFWSPMDYGQGGGKENSPRHQPLGFLCSNYLYSQYQEQARRVDLAKSFQESSPWTFSNHHEVYHGHLLHHIPRSHPCSSNDGSSSVTFWSPWQHFQKRTCSKDPYERQPPVGCFGVDAINKHQDLKRELATRDLQPTKPQAGAWIYDTKADRSPCPSPAMGRVIHLRS